MAGPALAQPQGPVVVLQFSGVGAEPARDAVIESLQGQGVDLLPLQQVQQTAGELGASLNRPQGRARVAAELGLQAYVSGNVSGRQRLKVKLTVYSGRDGSRAGVANMRFKRGSMVPGLQATAARKLKSTWRRTQAPRGGGGGRGARRDDDEFFGMPAAAPAPSARRNDEIVEPVEPRRPRRRRPQRQPEPNFDEPVASAGFDDEVPPGMGSDSSWADEELGDSEGSTRTPLWIGAGLSFLSRSLRYNDAVRELSDHRIDPNPSAHVQARFYPGAFGGSGFVANIGLDFRFSYLLFASSQRGELEFDTTATDLRLGAHVRLPIGDHDLGFGAGFGNQEMGFEPADDGSVAGVPQYAYKFAYGLMDLRLVFGSFAITPRALVAVPFDFGEIASELWFPNTTGLAFEAGIQAELTLGEGVAIFGGAAFRQWGLAFNPEVGDAGFTEEQRAAGGATDQYMMLELGVGYAL